MIVIYIVLIFDLQVNTFIIIKGLSIQIHGMWINVLKFQPPFTGKAEGVEWHSLIGCWPLTDITKANQKEAFEWIIQSNEPFADIAFIAAYENMQGC
jgi:hypothetical protein